MGHNSMQQGESPDVLHFIHPYSLIVFFLFSLALALFFFFTNKKLTFVLFYQ